jgi:CheY-like chemotaxis protein
MCQKTILIADDDLSLVRALAARCKRMGLGVRTASDALSALICIKETTPDVVCLDVNMPGGNGLSVCEMLTSEPAWRSIPVIMLTGHEDPNTIRRCHELCAYYVQKCPIIWPRIEPLLCEILDIEPLKPAIPAPSSAQS